MKDQMQNICSIKFVSVFIRVKWYCYIFRKFKVYRSTFIYSSNIIVYTM